MNHTEGKVAPNDQIQSEWKIKGRLKGPRKFKIWCEIYSVQNQALSGYPLEIAVKVKAECWFAQLCCVPNHWELGEVEMDSKQTRKFVLFNFGESTIHFQIEKLEKTLKFAHKNLIMIPNQGTIKPKSKKSILACLKVAQSGRFVIKVAYKVRLNRESSEIVDMNTYKLFTIKFVCHNSIIEVDDILDYNFNYLFGKIFLAEQMCIAKINNALRRLNSDDVKTVNISLPDYEVNANIFYVFLILKNKSNFETHVDLKRNKICACPLVQKAKGFTFTTKMYECKHRELFKMNLSGKDFESNSYQKLTITMRYSEVGPVDMSYAINLPQNRTLILNINYNVLPPNIDRPSRYRTSFELNLGTVCVCERRPSLKTFSFYNNSANNVSYSLEIPMKNENSQLECINPTGTLSPYSFHQLLFRFQPIRIKKYSYQIPIRLGQEQHVMYLFGRGVETISAEKRPKRTRPLLHSSQKIFRPETPIILSHSHLSCDKIPVWSSLEKLMFITNISENRLIGFSFQKCVVRDCVEAKVLYSKGVLKPYESCAVRIEVKSFGQPCRTRLQLPCKFLDHTQYYLHKQSLIAYNYQEEKIKNYFTITEKGTTYPINELAIMPMPTNFYRTVTIDVHVISYLDMDLHLKVDDQITHFPLPHIELNSSRILKSFSPPPLPTDRPLTSFIIEATRKQEKKEAKGNACKKKMPYVNINVIKDTLQCIIAQVLNSNMFKKALNAMNNSDPPHYSQFKPKSPEDELDRKNELFKELINPVPGTILSSILKELIADGIHEVFKLGPQLKNGDVHYTYNDKLKTKFPCTSRRCFLRK